MIQPRFDTGRSLARRGTALRSRPRGRRGVCAREGLRRRGREAARGAATAEGEGGVGVGEAQLVARARGAFGEWFGAFVFEFGVAKKRGAQRRRQG